MEKGTKGSERSPRKNRGERGRRADKDSLFPGHTMVTQAAFHKYFDVVIPCISASHILITLFLAFFLISHIRRQPSLKCIKHPDYFRCFVISIALKRLTNILQPGTVNKLLSHIQSHLVPPAT